MPTPSKGPRLGGSAAHERLMLANLATALFEHKKITTTAHRAKRLQPVAEKLITLAKRGDLHARRRVMTTVRRKDIVAELFEQTAPKFAERNGGYTRITQVAPRKGDNAPMAVIELVEALSEAVVAGYYYQAINADAPHPAAARLWQEFLYSDEGQNLWLKGYGRPVREAAMVEAGTIDEAAYAKLPEASGEPVTLTEEQTAKAGEYLAANWQQAIS